MSLLDDCINKYVEYKCSKAGSGDPVTKRWIDPNYGTPDVFYMMDEIKGRQVLHRFDKSTGVAMYTGTFRVLFKTEDMGDFCLIMRRVRNHWRVAGEYEDSYELEKGVYIVARYHPGLQSRIYLKGLQGPALERVVAKYEGRFRKKLPTVVQVQE